ncbi:MAG: hypothetical protein ISQ28_02370 [Alphaproteobacteria bacterium]|nr:hypothetical protein [Alphaproteobacteria bacterium]
MHTWIALTTKRGEEFSASENLSWQDFENFLPHREVTVRHARKLLRKKRPLFPGYIFVRLDLQDDDIRALKSTRGIRGIVCSMDATPAVLKQEIMTELIASCDEAGRLLPPNELKRGDRVKVSSGPLHEMVATVEKLASGNRVWLLFDKPQLVTKVSLPVEALTKLS